MNGKERDDSIPMIFVTDYPSTSFERSINNETSINCISFSSDSMVDCSTRNNSPKNTKESNINAESFVNSNINNARITNLEETKIDLLNKLATSYKSVYTIVKNKY